MTPKEKAKELVNKFTEYTKVFDVCDWVDDEISSKQCALIAVDFGMIKIYPFDGVFYFENQNI